MAEMTTLRRRMIEDMTIRNLSPATQRSYIHAVAKFSQYFRRSPDQLDLEDVRAYQVHLVGRSISWPSRNGANCARRVRCSNMRRPSHSRISPTSTTSSTASARRGCRGRVK
jgi:hypothetical protein